MNSEKRGIIMIPYAEIEEANSGLNIDKAKRKTIYYKNACVACISAKRCNPDYDVALVTNRDVPEPYASVLSMGG